MTPGRSPQPKFRAPGEAPNDAKKFSLPKGSSRAHGDSQFDVCQAVDTRSWQSRRQADAGGQLPRQSQTSAGHYTETCGVSNALPTFNWARATCARSSRRELQLITELSNIICNFRPAVRPNRLNFTSSRYSHHSGLGFGFPLCWLSKVDGPTQSASWFRGGIVFWLAIPNHKCFHLYRGRRYGNAESR